MSSQYNRKDHFYRQAKEQGARSRAFFKLKELNQKHALIKTGYKVLDLGAWPGGWLQESAELVGAGGKVVGIDLKPIDELGAATIQTIAGDASDKDVLARALEFSGSKFDVLLSDMSPKLSGIKEVDRAAALDCAEIALNAAKVALKLQGAMVLKVFKSNEAEQFVKTLRALFNGVMREELKASRNSSNEFYLVATGFKAA